MGAIMQVPEQTSNASLTRKVASLSPEQRFDRLTQLADASDTSDEGLLEFTKLLFGPDAQVSE